MVSLQTNILMLETWCSSAKFIHELHSGSCCFHCTCPIQGLLQYFTQLVLKIEFRSSWQSRDQSSALPSPQRALSAPMRSGYTPSSSFSMLHLEILNFIFLKNIFPQPGGHWEIVSRLAAGRWGSELRSQASFYNNEKTNSHFASLRVQRKPVLSALMKPPQFQKKVWGCFMLLKNDMLHDAEWPVFLTIRFYQKLSFASHHF